MTAPRVPFLDLTPADDAPAVREAIERVVSRGWFVLGPEVDAFEREFAAASQAAHAIGVGNGTDALALILRALAIGPGDEVIVPALTAAYTGLAVVMTGARPVFADVDPERLTIDPASCAAALSPATRAIIPVHLYGQAADLARVRAAAGDGRIAIVEDCCQAHLATCDGVPVGTGSVAGAFSFYPTKNLGALGDGGAVVTGDATLAERIRQLRNGGQTHRYQHLHAGVNSRLDDIQAAVLRARLPRLRAWTTRRREIAAAYRALLAGSPVRPVPEIDSGHVYHLFPVRSAERDRLQAHLRAAGVETLIHYPIALSRQPAFAPYAPATCPVAERAAGEVLSLPLHPRMTGEQVSLAADAIRAFEKGRAFA